MRKGTCKSCGADFWWTVTKNGKGMPVDLEPTPNGNLVLELAPDPRDPTLARYATTSDRAQQKWTSHFATCSGAAAHRVKP